MSVLLFVVIVSGAVAARDHRQDANASDDSTKGQSYDLFQCPAPASAVEQFAFKEGRPVKNGVLQPWYFKGSLLRGIEPECHSVRTYTTREMREEESLICNCAPPQLGFRPQGKGQVIKTWP